ncbi:uncharacterized protein LOC105662686 [Megachile rotundata]|uniref:uncharacterized protein LOC105662686 n=1 Tax=Megachile rotundata TaxID=143995 RepID=UPI003FD4C07C
MMLYVQLAYCVIILLANLQNAASAKYSGVSANSAGAVLDHSQNAMCDSCNAPGHPRGHASDPTQQGPLDSVENYSRTTKSRKSGFLNRYDQNVVAHFILRSQRSQRAMAILNRGESSASLTFSVGELQINFPMMKEWNMGLPYTDEMPTNHVVIVLRHHQGKRGDPNAEVFVQTIYPKQW